MTENRLRDLLRAAVPPQGPALQGAEVLRGARLRSLRRRQALGAAAMTVIVVAGAAIATSGASDEAGPAGPAPTPCGSPFAAVGPQRSFAFPRDGEQLEVTLKVGQYASIGWAQCDEYGTIEPSDRNGDTAPVVARDVGGVRPTDAAPQPTGFCCQRPDISKSITMVRVMAQRPGSVTYTGKGNRGSDGTIVFHVEDLAPSEGFVVSGLVDTSGLASHPAPEIVQLSQGTADGFTRVVLLDGSTSFSARVPQGTYRVLASSPAYNDGRVRCAEKTVTVTGADVSDVRITCTERI